MSQGKPREPRSAKAIVTDVIERDFFRPAMTRWCDRQLPRGISRLIFFPESQPVARPKVRNHKARLEKKRWLFYRSIRNIIPKICFGILLFLNGQVVPCTYNGTAHRQARRPRPEEIESL